MRDIRRPPKQPAQRANSKTPPSHSKPPSQKIAQLQYSKAEVAAMITWIHLQQVTWACHRIQQIILTVLQPWQAACTTVTAFPTSTCWCSLFYCSPAPSHISNSVLNSSSMISSVVQHYRRTHNHLRARMWPARRLQCQQQSG